MVARRYLPAMAITEKEIAHWTARVAELERQLDAAAKLSEVRMIAGELMRTRAALKSVKAKAASAALRPRRGKPRPNARHTASSEGDSATP
jgi:hypothetical protein